MNDTENQNLRVDFDVWYRNQKEMNPYIIRDYFIQKIQEREAAKIEEIEKLKQQILDERELAGSLLATLKK